MNPSKQLSSGKYFTSGAILSGRYASSGSPSSSGARDSELLIGEEINSKAPIAFRLAPRLYSVLCELTGDYSPPASVASAVAALPIQLAFRELGRADRLRQCWVSDRASCCYWQLIVEQDQGSMLVTLTAETSASSIGEPMIWRPQDVWDPFGTNRLHPEPVGTGVPPLIVRAP